MMNVAEVSLGESKGGFRSYLKATRDPFTSVVLVLPLFLAYQIGILATGGMRNGVDFVSNLLFTALGGDITWYFAFNGAVLVAFIVAILVMRKRGHFEARAIPWMILESGLYAVLLGTAVIALINVLGLGGLLSAAAVAKHPMTLVDKLVMSAGAGFYEEIVFRGFLMGGLFFALTRGLSMPRFLAAVIAIVASSVLFSAAHHITEPFTMQAFVFRIFAGMLFAVIFQTRGLAVAAYTHALYDVWVMVFHHAS